MAGILKELETRVNRTYMGGKLLDEFLGKETGEDSFYPEDWISSFTEARNKTYVPNEGITRLENGELITQAVGEGDFGQGRTEPGVLIKLLDSSERLGIQAHPDDAFSQRVFGTPYGKTEAWHVLKTRDSGNVPSCVYLGFREGITREKWEDYYRRQDIDGMLEAMHRIEVKPGDTILVCGRTPHAIGGGCLLLEIQQPSDYTMRCETKPLSGEAFTPKQIHYGAGEEAMLDCFDYTPRTCGELSDRFILKPEIRRQAGAVFTDYITYSDTPCFALSKLEAADYVLKESFFLTIVCTKDGGSVNDGNETYTLKRGDKFFIPADTAVRCIDCELLVCYPPEKK